MIIFNLSVSKTGTTSLEYSLNILPNFKTAFGTYKSWYSPFLMGNLINNNSYYNLKNFIDNSGYNVFSDAPFWDENLLDFYTNNYPDEYFILITRNCNDWVESLFKMLNIDETHTSLFNFNRKNHILDSYGTFPFINFLQYSLKIKRINKSHFKQKYNQHNNNIINYFIKKNLQRKFKNKKPIKFFTCDLNDPNISSKIAAFLNIPQFKLFHHNKTLK